MHLFSCYPPLRMNMNLQIIRLNNESLKSLHDGDSTRAFFLLMEAWRLTNRHSNNRDAVRRNEANVVTFCTWEGDIRQNCFSLVCEESCEFRFFLRPARVMQEGILKASTPKLKFEDIAGVITYNLAIAITILGMKAPGGKGSLLFSKAYRLFHSVACRHGSQELATLFSPTSTPDEAMNLKGNFFLTMTTICLSNQACLSFWLEKYDNSRTCLLQLKCILAEARNQGRDLLDDGDKKILYQNLILLLAQSPTVAAAA